MIYSYSKFNYGHSVDITNPYIPFKEGAGPELIATIAFGHYTLSEYAQAVQDALNVAGAFDYSVTVDRSANHLVINATGTFSLLVSTGSVVSTSAFAMMGFVSATDLTGDNVYRSNATSGREFYCQFYLQSYVPSANKSESISAVINESADGNIEVVRFGVRRKIEMDIKFITNLPMDGIIIRNNPNGLQAARDFFDYTTQKKRFEFVVDITDPDTFEKVLLESMPGYSDGTGYELKEKLTESLPDIYETGVITLRVVV